MPTKIIYSIIFVLTFLVELLLDPSTNFVRAGVRSLSLMESDLSIVPMAKVFLKISDHQDSSESDKDDSENSGNSHNDQDIRVCYATTIGNFEIAGLMAHCNLVCGQIKVYEDKYFPSIFHPPKYS